MTGLRRVVVTGLGIVSPLGVGTKYVWSRLLAGDCGVVSLRNKPHLATNKSYDDLPSQIAGLVPRSSQGIKDGTWRVEDWLTRGEEKKTAPFIHYAIAASQQALEDAGWKPETDHERMQTGVCIGSGIGCIDEVYNTALAYHEHGLRKVHPYFVPKILTNLAAGHVSMRFGLQGPNHSCSTACATGAHSIGDAARFIQHGDADVMLAGGTEASVSPARSLSTAFNDTPEQASRPFDRDRDGFVIGEGAGVVVLEELEHAKARGARVYAELKGYGASGDAYHITAPTEDGRGAANAMRRALAQAGVGVHEVGYVNAHATSTDLGDLAETRAIKSVFQGPSLESVAVSSTKGATGHLLGAAGAVEAIFTILSIYNDVLPPSLNLHHLHDEFTLNYVALQARDLTSQGKRVKAALNNSFGFGGTNSIILAVFFIPDIFAGGKKQTENIDNAQAVISEHQGPPPWINENETLSCVEYDEHTNLICCGDLVSFRTTGKNGLVNILLPHTHAKQRILGSHDENSRFTIYLWNSTQYDTMQLPWNTLPSWILDAMNSYGYFNFQLQSTDGLWLQSTGQVSAGKKGPNYKTPEVHGNQRAGLYPPSDSTFIWVRTGIHAGGGYILSESGTVLWSGRPKSDWLYFDSPGNPTRFPGCELQTSWKMKISGSPFDRVLNVTVGTAKAIESMSTSEMWLNDMLITNHDTYAHFVSSEISGSFKRKTSTIKRTGHTLTEEVKLRTKIPVLIFESGYIATKEEQSFEVARGTHESDTQKHSVKLNVRIPGRSYVTASLFVTRMELQFDVTWTISRQLPHGPAYTYNVSAVVSSEQSTNARATISKPTKIDIV
ncbi:hypothetical protein SmJEL517_g04967 [Synchytrium microbalum]|uniref:beta-ketoacyl-[acyl-carrier-protein] synthase I n=1 Tax=Synchytrium microbalum TaxID=1806994 RepID=A0A507BXD8_9FUNG|nr:uncharacterized protein SmJEL517_g04967 [Synchytrium microbalum]TPX31798.1 hypothetical protein SmJEL517_g04967 [Synchytrium microbalum]